MPTSTIPDRYDVCVIGGGVNGAGIARDAAGRGASVLLLERGDLAQGTSSASTKLIHGGLRYLEQRQFGLVRESLIERERLWRIAPHIVRPLRFVLPHHAGMRPRWLLRLGLFIYDHIGGRRLLPATDRIDLTQHIAGAPLKREFRKGFAYSDCWVDDARLVVLNVLDAAERGATICPRTEVRRIERRDDHWMIETGDRRFEASVVVNAAGPSVLELLRRADVPSARHMRLVRGSHIIVPKLFEHDYAYFLQLRDGRIFFAIPYQRDFTLIGTTDRDHQGSLIEVSADAGEIAYLCDAANGYFKRRICPADVVWSYSGVRPLIDDGSGKPEAATRGYRLDIDRGGSGSGAPMLSVFGGKITSYRRLAAEAVDMLQAFLPGMSGGDWTASEALPGGDFAVGDIDALIARLATDYPFLSAESAERVARAYGTRAVKWLADADPALAFGEQLTAAEIDYLITVEWARTADDILWRRTKLRLTMTAADQAKVASYVDQIVQMNGSAAGVHQKLSL